MKKSKLSIVTVSYNSEKTIRDTIESILGQNSNDYEYIIVDGNSKDSTIKIIEGYEKSFSGKMRVISEKDNGIYDAMNKGIRLAKYDYVLFLGSDDVLIDNNVVADVINDINNYDNIDIFLYNVEYKFANGLIKKCKKTTRNFNTFNLLRGISFCHQGIIANKKSLINGFDDSFAIAADYEWLLRQIYQEKVSYCNKERSIVRYNMCGTSSNGIKLLEEYKRVEEKYLSRFLVELKNIYKTSKYKVGSFKRSIFNER